MVAPQPCTLDHVALARETAEKGVHACCPECDHPFAVTWTHPDGRRITVYPDRKIRFRFFENDEWRVLYRRDVPNLTDQDWYAAPGDGWQRTETPTQRRYRPWS